jgi:hypothetical protein
MPKETLKIVKIPQRIVVYEASKDTDYLMEASFPPGFKIEKVVGEPRKRIARGSAGDTPLD